MNQLVEIDAVNTVPRERTSVRRDSPDKENQQEIFRQQKQKFVAKMQERQKLTDMLQVNRTRVDFGTVFAGNICEEDVHFSNTSDLPIILCVSVICPEFEDLDEYVYSARKVTGYDYNDKFLLNCPQGKSFSMKVALKVPNIRQLKIISGTMLVSAQYTNYQKIPGSYQLSLQCSITQPTIECPKMLLFKEINLQVIQLAFRLGKKLDCKIPFRNNSLQTLSLDVDLLNKDPAVQSSPTQLAIQQNCQFLVTVSCKSRQEQILKNVIILKFPITDQIIQMKARFQTKSQLNVKFIIVQISSLLSVFYCGQLILCLFMDFAFNLQFHIGQLFDFSIAEQPIYQITLLCCVLNVLFVVIGLVQYLHNQGSIQSLKEAKFSIFITSHIMPDDKQNRILMDLGLFTNILRQCYNLAWRVYLHQGRSIGNADQDICTSEEAGCAYILIYNINMDQDQEYIHNRTQSNVSFKSKTSQDLRHLRATFSSNRKQMRIESAMKFEQLHTLRDFEQFLRMLSYKKVRLVGKGAHAHVFRAINAMDQLVAVRVLRSSEENLRQALLEQQRNTEMASNFRSTLFQYQIIEVEDVLVIEEDLATSSLEDELFRRGDEKFSDREVKQILQDLVEQLFALHMTRQCVHNDIKPENVLIKNGKYILGDLGAVQHFRDNTAQLDTICGTPLYMSPKKLDHYHGDQSEITMTIKMPNLTHDPFKSDIYSLGLVLLRLLLHNDGITQQVQIENIFFHHRNELLQNEIDRHKYYFSEERFLMYNNEVRQIKPLLSLLLMENEEDRISTLDLALMTFMQFQSYRTPYTNFFNPYVYKIETGLRVTYSLKNLIYEGQCDNLIRSGRGVMFKPNKGESHQNAKQIAEISSKYRNEKKAATILEEEETEYGQSQLHLEQSRRQTIFHEKRHQVIYDGTWAQNLPHGDGVLHLYSIESNQQFTELESSQGRLYAKVDDEQEQELLRIKSCFYYGLLHKRTIIRYATHDEEYEYCLNVNRNLTSAVVNFDRQHVKFIEHEETKAILGYSRPHEFIILDFTDVKNQDFIIQTIQQAFISQPTLMRVQYECNEIVSQFTVYCQELTIQIILKFTVIIQKRTQISERFLQKQSSPMQFCCFADNAKSRISSKQKESTLEYSQFSIKEQEGMVLDQIFENPLSQLQKIDLHKCNFARSALDALTLTNQFIKLEHLDLSGSVFQDQQVATLLMSQKVHFLKSLNLSQTRVSGATSTALTNSDSLQNLFRINVSGCDKLFDFIEFIASDNAKKIVSLDISQNQWVDSTFLKVLVPVYVPNLRELNLNGTKLKQKEIRQFKTTELGQKIQLIVQTQVSFDMAFQEDIQPEVGVLQIIKNLSDSGFVSYQEQLLDQKITDETLKSLSISPGLINVSKLLLQKQDVTDIGVGCILQSSYAGMISAIDLSRTSITGDILSKIANSKMINLKTIILRECNNIDANDLNLFVLSVKAAQIHHFEIDSQKITTKSLVTALKKLNNLQITVIKFSRIEQKEDISPVLRNLLSWVLHLISKRQLKQIVINLSNCQYIGDGFNAFAKDIWQFKQDSLRIVIKITKQESSSTDSAKFPDSILESIDKHPNIKIKYL